MKKGFNALFLLLFFTLPAIAQNSIQSTVFDSKNGLPLEMATVRLLKQSDSTLVQGAQTDVNGGFLLPKVKIGNYIVVISTIGYTEQKRNVTVAKKDLILKSFQLVENAKLLSEVEVKGTAAQMVVKGDTLEYNATAFKTQENAVVEDLLKRLPGVEISTEGKITVNGQEVKKIRVDGKKFFGNDMEMTTKNLPAEMIDKIQVLEQKSDMALLTGFEDDETERIINLTLKPNRKKGMFGTFTGGAGVDTNKEVRYDNNLFLNIMQGESQTAITGGANNINTTRSSRGRSGGSSGGSGGSSFSSPSGGITSTQNLGVNNNTEVNPKLKIGGDAGFNHSENFSDTKTNKQSYLSESISNDTTNTVAGNNQYAGSLRLEAEWKIDSLRTLVIQPTIDYSTTSTYSNRDYDNYTNGSRRSWGDSNNSGNTDRLSGGLNLIYSKKSASKKGRSFTTSLNTGFSQTFSESFNISNRYTNTGVTNVNQRTDNNSDRYNVNLRLSFVEPLWNIKNMLETSISVRASTSNSDKKQYNNFNEGKLDSTYSNVFKNNFFNETLELNYRYTEKDYNLTLGLKGEPSQTYSYRTYANGVIRPYETEIINFAPNARFQYNFGKKEFARIDYRGNTEQPSISQMQPVKNNSNLMNETVGNPELNPSFYQYLRFMYSKFNDKKFSSFSVWFSGGTTKDALVTNSIYNETNKQYSQTVNATQNPYNFNGNIMFNTPIIAKRLHFNTSTSGGYNMRYGYTSRRNEVDINTENLQIGDLSKTGRINAEQKLSLTFTQDVIEIGARGNFKYSNTINNLNPTPSTTYDWTGSGNLVLRLPYSINISSDINYTTRKGYSNFDLDETIWNAAIDKTLFKGKGVLALKWNDILRQQLNIRQIIGDNYISYSKYNTLTSYFILSFSYKLNKFGGSKNETDKREYNRFGPGTREGERMRGGEGSGMGGRRPGGDF